MRQAAWVQGASSGVEMEVWTTEPGLQFYIGQHVSTEARGLGGRRYQPYAGLCLEPQVWPDSPNRPYFPQATLWPGQMYRQTTEYRFRLD
jgi:aldose 1-epimerase